MGTLDDEFAFLASSVERAVEVQEQAARHLLAVSLGRGEVLAKRLISHYEFVRSLVAERREEFEEFPDEDELKEGAITEMRMHLGYAREDLQRCLAWLDAASESVLDLGTGYLIEFFASRLVSPNSEVTVVTKADGSYSISVSEMLEESAGDGEEEDREVAIVVFIPRREQSSGLLHTLILHELGHAASKQHGLAQQIIDDSKKGELKEEHRIISQVVASAIKTNESTRKGICALLELDPMDPEDSEAVTEAAEEFLWLTAKYCVEEAICDAFAIQLLGPTYLYAFAAIVGTADLDTFDHKHPTSRLRIRLMLEHLQELGWTELLEANTPEILAWFRDRASEEGAPLEGAAKFNARAVEALVTDVRSVVAEHVGELAFPSSEFEDSTRSAVAELLEVGIPPAQLQDLTGIPAGDARNVGNESDRLHFIGRPQIILGSWLYALESGGNSLAAIAKAPALPELSTLLPKALELSALQRGWVEAT